ncbi:uncharacterized protein LOC106085286 [Stomoxys calcitrans]|uniref:Uncharacterized protein n=1 Tax=Stomoxys calcitrans TaxID=35570 RepID=A0A1I8PZD6_STOCA|nr:uncharacterized protein LOC106085286 [Stomoxys calcitrans]
MKLIYISVVTLVVTVICVGVAEADLKSDLREFVDLAPRNRIGYIAARRYIVDYQYRAALKYLQSSRFARTWLGIRNSTEFHDLLGFLQAHGVSLEALQDVTGVIDKLPNQLREFHIPSKVPVSVMMQRNLESFMREVIQVLPRARYSGLMARKVKENGDFARLYRAVRQQEFKQMLTKAQTSPNLMAHWLEMRANYVEVNSLVQVAYEVISWGP